MAKLTYAHWPREPQARWMQAGNTFGRHLMSAARDYALARIPASASPAEHEVATKAALDAIYGMMMLLDGVAESKIDETHTIRYALVARVFASGQREAIEQFELAPEGDGLCLGFHGWTAGESDDS